MVTRPAGHHARRTARLYAYRALAALAVLCATPIVLLGWTDLAPGPLVLVELVVIVAALLLERLAGPVIDRWIQGARGEEHVGRVLAELEPDGWLTVHDVDTGRGNIDSIVVGPGGLFTVEVKSYEGRLDPDRIRPADLKQAYAQKKWLERLTDRPATALLVYSRAYLLGRGVSRRKGVLVLPARLLAAHLRRRAPQLPPGEVRRLHELLARA